MRNQLIFILSLTALVTVAGCDKKYAQHEADGSTTVKTDKPVAGTANDLSAAGTVPGQPSGVASEAAVKRGTVSADQSFRAQSVNPNDPTNKDVSTGAAVRSGTSAEINKFDSGTTGAQNTSGTTSGARTAGKTSSGTSKSDGSYNSDSRNKGNAN